MNQRIEYNVVEFSEEAKSAFRKSLEASFIGSEKKPMTALHRAFSATTIPQAMCSPLSKGNSSIA